MSALQIRDVDEKTLLSLKRLARKHHRSLQMELHAILEKAAALDKEGWEQEDWNLVTVRTGNSRGWSREEIYGDDSR